MRVCVLTTSYPRHAGDVAGLFVQDAVEHLRASGVSVAVVSPGSFRHFGIAYGDGIANNLRAAPWRALLFFVFLGYLFYRLSIGRGIGRALQAAGDDLAARVRPMEWGLTAALVATMASNFFYLTMSFYYFFVLAMLAIVAPAVFVRRLVST